MLATTTMNAQGIALHRHELLKLPSIRPPLHAHADHGLYTPPPQKPVDKSPPVAKISNSERAKFYRRQHKERTRVLASTVTTLRRDVQQLALKTELLRGLVFCDVCGPPRDRIQSHIYAFFADPHVELPGFTIQTRRLGTVTVHGTPQATVVDIALELEGVYPATSLEAVYHSIPGNAVLLDTLMHSRVRYACVVRLWFGSTGDFETGDVEIDWVRGLLECVDCLRDVNRVAGPFERLGKPTLQL